MGSSSVAKVTKRPSVSETITAEEKQLLDLYRKVSRWEKNSFFVMLQSVALGRLTDQTDRWSWDRLSRTMGLPKVGMPGA